MAGGKDNLPAFHASVEGIAGAKSKLSPDGTGKNHLPLAGNAGLHGKNILPREGLGTQDGVRNRSTSRRRDGGTYQTAPHETRHLRQDRSDRDRAHAPHCRPQPVRPPGHDGAGWATDDMEYQWK